MWSANEADGNTHVTSKLVYSFDETGRFSYGRPRGVNGLAELSRLSFVRADQSVDFGDGYGLGQMMIEPGLARPAPVVVLAISAHGHEQYVGKPRILTKLLSDFIAVHSRETDIEDHGVGLERHRSRKGLGSVMRGLDGMTLEAEHRPQSLGRILIVVHDEDAAGSRSAGLRICRPRCSFTVHLIGEESGKVYRELGALSQAGALGFDPAAVRLDETSHQRETNA